MHPLNLTVPKVSYTVSQCFVFGRLNAYVKSLPSDMLFCTYSTRLLLASVYLLISCMFAQELSCPTDKNAILVHECVGW